MRLEDAISVTPYIRSKAKYVRGHDALVYPPQIPVRLEDATKS